MKAVSTFIATVLIIAFTVAIGGIVSTFIYNTMSTQSEETKASSDKAARCGSVFLDIDEVKTNSDMSTVNITFTYVNGDEDLYNFTVYVIDSGNRINRTSNLSPTYTEASPLNSGRKTFWSVSTTGLSGSLFSVRIVGLCQKDYTVSASCESGKSCMTI